MTILFRNDGNGTDSGHVRLYENVNGTWTQIGADIDGEAAGDYSGYSVSLSADGTVVAIGAPGNDDNGSESGHVRVFNTDVVVKTAPIAVDDSFNTDEDTSISGNVLDTNPSTPDSDPDGDLLTVTEVDGNAANIGTAMTLASGALLTLNGDGSFDYDPNGQFEALNNGQTDTDTFTYTIDDGNGATAIGTVTVTIDGVSDCNPTTGDDDLTSCATPGADDINALAGNDTLNGGVGNDTLNSGGYNNTLNGGDGNDTLKVEGGYNNTLNGGLDNDALYGGNNDDNIDGGEDNDTLNGGAGADILLGGNHNDKLVGGDGEDTLIGGLGVDRLFGGAGSDFFRLESTTFAHRDVIKDFEDGTDLLELDGNLTFGALTITQVESNTNIIETATTEIIAILQDIDASDIDINDFV